MSDRGGILLLTPRHGATADLLDGFLAAGYAVFSDDTAIPGPSGDPPDDEARVTLAATHDALLAELGESWLLPPDDAAQRTALKAVLPRLITRFEQITAAADGLPLAICDHRIGALLALWEPIMAGRLEPVLVITDPSAVAERMASLEGASVPFALAVWELEMTRLLRHCHGRTIAITPGRGCAVSDRDSRGASIRALDRALEPGLSNDGTRAPGTDGTAGPVVLSQAAAASTKGWGPPDLTAGPRSGALRDSIGDHLTLRQERLRAWLHSLPIGPCVLDLPADLREVSDITKATVAAELDRRRASRRLSQAATYREQVRDYRAWVESERRAEISARRAVAEALAAAEGRLAQLEADRETGERLLSGALDAATRRAAQAEQRHAAVLATRSWRVTRHMRTVAGLVRALSELGRRGATGRPSA